MDSPTVYRSFIVNFIKNIGQVFEIFMFALDDTHSLRIDWKSIVFINILYKL